MKTMMGGGLEDLRRVLSGCGYSSATDTWTRIGKQTYELELDNGVVVRARLIGKITRALLRRSIGPHGKTHVTFQTTPKKRLEMERECGLAIEEYSFLIPFGDADDPEMRNLSI